jgi:hypothetical protein
MSKDMGEKFIWIYILICQEWGLVCANLFSKKFKHTYEIIMIGTVQILTYLNI